MLEIVAKYWLDFLLGAIATGLTIACKKIYKLYSDEKKHQRSEMYNDIRNDLEKLIIKVNEESAKADEAL